jgi:hypothetical protein
MRKRISHLSQQSLQMRQIYHWFWSRKERPIAAINSTEVMILRFIMFGIRQRMIASVIDDSRMRCISESECL